VVVLLHAYLTYKNFYFIQVSSLTGDPRYGYPEWVRNLGDATAPFFMFPIYKHIYLYQWSKNYGAYYKQIQFLGALLNSVTLLLMILGLWRLVRSAKRWVTRKAG
jgi:hypothetical protein